jgi:Family of unknown function (DUF6188)
MVDATATQRLGRLVGRTVWQVRVDNEFTLAFLRQLGDDPRTPDLRLSVGGWFTYVEPDGREHDCGNDLATLGPALRLFGQVVRQVWLSENGDLTVEFEDDSRLVVPCDPNYEPWRLWGPDGPTLASPPGGGQPRWPTSG